MMFVIDTSALIRLYIPDGPLPNGLESALRGVERGNDLWLAPELILAEAGQVLYKKQRQDLLTENELNEIVDGILALPMRLFSHRELLKPACLLAPTVSLTVYDALFLVLAERHGAMLMTADTKLRRVADRMNL